MKPAVSVIVATYNYGCFLAAALDSVRAQTFDDFEAIVIDDGSTDDSAAVVRPYLKDGRFRYQRSEHLGQPRAKNAGIHLARAELVAFLDADDLWLPAKLARQIELFRRDPGLGVAYTRRRLIDADSHELQYEQPVLHRGNVLDAIFRSNFVCFSSVMVRRAVFEQIGLFDETLPLAIDYDLWLRAALLHRFDYVDDPLVKYRVGHANLSRRFAERLEIAKRIMDRFVHEHGGADVLAPATVRAAYAETWYHLAAARLDRSRWLSCRTYFRSLAYAPARGATWRGLVHALLPAALWRGLRRLARRPDYGARKRLLATRAPAHSL